MPILFLNLPVSVLAGMYAERRRKSALAKSKVKIRGFDVMLTEKVVFCLVVVPSLWIFYGILMVVFTDLDLATVALTMFSFPLFAYMGIIVADSGMVELRDLRPFYIRLFPSTRQRLAVLPETRRKLQDDLRAFIKAIGPGLGDIYSKKELDWKEIMDASYHQLPTLDDEAKKEK